MDNIWFIAAFWMGLALLASLISIRLGISVALIEGGLSSTALGKMLLAACFITDFGTVLALGILFADFNIWLVVFVTVTTLMLWFMPKWTQYLITRLGATRVSEPEVKFLFLVLFFLGGLASTAKSEAVLPAYLLGLVVAGVFLRDKTLVHRMRSIAFAVFTPFYFIKAGLFVSLPALRRAVVLAKEFNAQITALWVREPLPRYTDLPGEPEGEAEAADEYFQERKREVEAAAQEHGLATACETRRGHPAKTIVTMAKEGDFDLIVVGHSDHSEMWGRLLGDTADRISDHAHCSVLIVKN